MSNRSKHVKKWRKTVKETIVKSMGGKCCICNYCKCNNALELHHLDPSLKEFSSGQIMSNPKSWAKIIVELRKCVLVCSNCHREIHDGIAKVPENYSKFDETYINHNNYPRAQQTPCVVCGKMKPSYNLTCSKECRSKRTWHINWDGIDIEKLKSEGYSVYQIGDLVGASGSAVCKRLKRIINVRNNKNKYKSKNDLICLNENIIN